MNLTYTEVRIARQLRTQIYPGDNELSLATHRDYARSVADALTSRAGFDRERFLMAAGYHYSERG